MTFNWYLNAQSASPRDFATKSGEVTFKINSDGSPSFIASARSGANALNALAFGAFAMAATLC